MIKKIFLFLMFTASVSAKVVLISFDGSGYLDMWQDTINLAKQENVHFTYFVSAPYFVTESEAKTNPYWALSEIKNEPCLVTIRPDSKNKGVRDRFQYLNQAVAAHCEIASHLCGHYHGDHFTYTQWMKEFAWFKWALSNTGEFDFKNVSGVRAPYLAVNPDYFRALKNSGYAYDSSTGSVNSPALILSETGVEEIPIHKIKLMGAESTSPYTTILPFDCDFITLVQDKLPIEPVITKDEEDYGNEETMQNIFFYSICNQYLSSPIPTQICLHFQHRDGEPYYKAMIRFIAWGIQNGAEFLTYKEYLDRNTK